MLLHFLKTFFLYALDFKKKYFLENGPPLGGNSIFALIIAELVMLQKKMALQGQP
jgi:hypothetical protein